MKVDSHKHAQQPKYHTKPAKIRAREQVVAAYREITGHHSIPSHLGYWTLCNWQPDEEGAEIVQLVDCGLIQKEQFHGIDLDVRGEGIIEFNRQCHPEAHWFQGDLIEVIEEHYEDFHPALLYADYTRTVVTTASQRYLAKTMNLCPSGTVVAANTIQSSSILCVRTASNNFHFGS